MVAGALDHRGSAGIAHREALAGHAGEEGFAGNGAVEAGVADDDIVARLARHAGGRPGDQGSAGEALAGIIVRVADELERHAACEECAEALSGGSAQKGLKTAVAETSVAEARRDLARQ